MRDVLHELIIPALDNVKASGAGYMARCPAHEDSKASLAVGPGKDQPVVFYCHAGCTSDAVLAEFGLTWADLSNPKEDKPSNVDDWTPAGPAIAIYDYRDEDGRLLFQVCRTAAKEFRQRVPDAASKKGWRWSLGDTRRVLYRLQQVIKAVEEGRQVWIVEGEKDVHALETAGMVATCSPGGAGKWKTAYTEHLRDAVIVIVADKDKPGQAHARQVWDSLVDVADSMQILEAAEGKDAADHLGAGLGLHQFVQTRTSEEPPKPELAMDFWDFIHQADEPYNWLVPNVLERGDRLILTGPEGGGKSVLMTQLAVTLAAGVNPFFHTETIKPVRVLVIDCENSERQSRRRYRKLAEIVVKQGRRFPPGMLRLLHRPEGIDLTKPTDRAWLMERVMATRPDVLFLGPFYRLHSANINDELPARQVVSVLDQVRTAVDCALITEAHAGHGPAGQVRSLRPAGSSLLLRWPEFGFGLRPEGERRLGGRPIDMRVEPWRGARDDRAWPSYLTYGDPGDWPWKPSFGVPADPRHVGPVVDPRLSAAALSKGTQP
ncbi:AAA family ATPase [Phytomonospora sp. NPDC050363]|uniref:AAA family ATPase n=1 Tax=Phytomonospora sp. NPDC050363 TaxID=3155642 RepID=UPI0033F91D9E